MLLDSFSSASPAAVAVYLIVVPCFYFLYAKLLRQPTVFDQLPWAGRTKDPKLRELARTNTRSRRDEVWAAYKTYSEKDEAFIWQQYNGPPMVILPPSQLRFILDQPHSVLNVHEFFNDMLALETVNLDPHVHGNPLQNQVVKNQLTRSLAKTPMTVLEELSLCFDEYWGNSPDWQEQTLLPSMLKFVSRSINRIFVGEELCRNEDFLELTTQWTGVFFNTGFSLRPYPRLVRRMFGRYLARDIYSLFGRVHKHVAPIVERRKALLEEHGSNHEDRPEDLLQWLIQVCYASNDRSERDTSRIVKRFVNVILASLHTTALNNTILILDLAASDPKENYVGQIRDQINEVHREFKGQWTKQALLKLSLLDSALRESLRVSGTGSAWTPQRKVVASQGITLPNGLHLPTGAHLGVPSYGIHHQEIGYTYDPFRTARSRETKSKGRSEMVEERNLQATATGLDYLPFGHGRDACPGRFFASQEIKLTMIHLLRNYEIRPMEKPEEFWVADMVRAPGDAKVSFRKITPPSAD